MANDLNQCNFIGRLGADPEVRYMPAGEAVANIRIAVGWKSKDKEGAEWVPVVFFGKPAEIVEKYLKKGSRVFVSGRFRTRKWQDQQGQDRYTTEIVANNMQMLDSRGSESTGEPSQPQQQPGTAPPVPGPSLDNFDDDIPF